MMLQAKVQSITGNTQHYIGTIAGGRVVRQTRIDDPEYVQISEGDNGYYLLRFNSDNVCLADSWFETLEEAKRQAEFEYAISESHWEHIE